MFNTTAPSSEFSNFAELENRSTKEGETNQEQQQNKEVVQIPNKYIQLLRWSISRILIIVFLSVLLVWIIQVEGGLGFTEGSVFGFHALFMSLFVVLFTQEAILAFSSPLLGGPYRNRNFCTPSLIKDFYYHLACHILGLVSLVLGIVAIVYYKKLSPQPPVFPFFSVYSPHSWLGIAMLGLWGIQILAGIYTHLFAKPEEKLILVKVHQFLGKVIYVTGLATCALGLQDMQSSDLASSSSPMNMAGSDDMSMGNNMDMLMGNGTWMNMTGYFPHSMYAQYSSGCTILLFFLGVTVFSILSF